MITPWLFEFKSIPQYIDMRRKDQLAFETLKAELQKAFAVPDCEYIELSSDDIINRNN